MVTHNPESTDLKAANPFAGAPQPHDPSGRAAVLSKLFADAPRMDTATRAEVLDYVHKLQAEGVHVVPVTPGAQAEADDATDDPKVFDDLYNPGDNVAANLGKSTLVVANATGHAERAAVVAWHKANRGAQVAAKLPEAPTVTFGNTAQWWGAPFGNAVGMPDVTTVTHDGVPFELFNAETCALVPGSVATDASGTAHHVHGGAFMSNEATGTLNKAMHNAGKLATATNGNADETHFLESLNLGTLATTELQRELARREAKDALNRLDNYKLTKNRAPIEPMSLTDLMAAEAPAQRWIINDLWTHKGQTLMYAPAKVGKSRFAHNVIESLTSGNRFLGRFKVPELTGNVGLIDFELDPFLLRDRLADLDRMDNSRVVVWPMRSNPAQMNLNNPEAFERMVKQLKDNDIEVLILDPLSALIRALGMDEWHEGAQALNLIKQMCEDAGVRGHLVVDHASSKQGGSANGPRGDSGKQDVPDHLWKLSPDRDNKPYPAPENRYHLDTSGRALTASLTMRLESQRFIADGEVDPAMQARARDYAVWCIAHKLIDADAEQGGGGYSKTELTGLVWAHPDNEKQGGKRYGRDAVREALDALMATAVLARKGDTSKLKLTDKTPPAPESVPGAAAFR
ncbi:AAA family ATPase [Corynebacterium casei]|uniref:AAA family ATPase n=1 Tax=Corynebacterium casei TaxID=160386 RepID=UPI003FD29443